MKKSLKIILQWAGLTPIFSVLWIGGMMAGNLIFPSELMNATANDHEGQSTIMMLTVSALNTAVVLLFIYRSTLKSWKLAATVFLIMFGIQYFMAQIETLWFNDSLQLPLHGIYAIISGGAITAALFAIAATWITGNFRSGQTATSKNVKISWPSFIKMTVLLAVVIWPAVYFLAGYFIAWQFEAVRVFYSGTAEMASFLTMMRENFASGLYFFQIFRGVMWVLIALLVITAAEGKWLRKAILLGLLLTVLGSSGLLLPNPYMSEPVRMAHLLETSTSNFFWGMIMAWSLRNTIVLS